MKNSKSQILVTIGPSSSKPEVLGSLIQHQMDAARLNLSWGTLEEKKKEIEMVRSVARENGRKIPIIIDLPGPRIQNGRGHTYEHEALSAITEKDKEFIKFGVEQGVDYVAASFVGGPEDVEECRKVIKSHSGKTRIIAKIERKEALRCLKDIIRKSDAIMVARGDLGDEIPIEQVPFAQDRIIKEAKKRGKPVIVATQMLLSMVDCPAPTRAEVTDVANAILEGADAVMLSEETTIGKYPVETVAVMEKIVEEAEKHIRRKLFNPLRCLK